jgi:hypothetical protein
VFSTASFIPQIRNLREQRHGRRISLTYVLFNLILATQQLTVYLLYFILREAGYDGIAHEAPTFGDWLDLIQFGIVWLCHSVLYGNPSVQSSCVILLTETAAA